MGRGLSQVTVDTYNNSLIIFCRPDKGEEVATCCPKCQSENSETAKFCSECATPLKSAEEISVTKILITPEKRLQKGSTVGRRYTIIEELGS
jgi:predicted amidophosphoribosyltransferase